MGFLLPLFDKKDIGILIDTGHLKVSAHTFNYDPIEMTKLFNPYIKVAQLSENDGTEDQNSTLSEKSWFWDYVHWEQLDYVSLEISGQSIETLKDQIELTRYKINEYYDKKNI